MNRVLRKHTLHKLEDIDHRLHFCISDSPRIHCKRGQSVISSIDDTATTAMWSGALFLFFSRNTTSLTREFRFDVKVIKTVYGYEHYFEYCLSIMLNFHSQWNVF